MLENLCVTCKVAVKFEEISVLDETDQDKSITWYQSDKVVGAKGKEYLERVAKKGKVADIYKDLCTMLPSFLLHYFINQKQ